MSSRVNSKNTIEPGTILSARNISRSVKNLQPSREVIDLLARIEGTIRLEFSAESQTFSASIVDRKGKFLTTIAEFEEISRYKAIARDAEKDNEKTKKGLREVALLHNLRAVCSGSSPDRIIEGNKNRLNQIVNWHEAIVANLNIIESLPDSEYKTYLLAKGKILKSLYFSEALDCVGTDLFRDEYHAEKLLKIGIPKSIDIKLTDKAFTKDARDAKLLLFPRGNYLKSVSFTTAEIKDEAFLNANMFIMSNSGALLSLAGSDELKKFYVVDKTNTAEMDSAWDKFQWPLLSPGTVEDYLEPRIKRVGLKHFQPSQSPRDRGNKESRPETTLQKKIRDARNFQQHFVSIVINYCHFVPNVDDPLVDFWSAIFEKTDEWQVTPDKTLYSWMKDHTSKDKTLGELMNLSNQIVKDHLLRQLCGALKIPESSQRFKDFKKIIDNVSKNDISDMKIGPATCKTELEKLPTKAFEELESVKDLTVDNIAVVNTFRGKVTKELQKAERKEAKTGRNILDTYVTKHLSFIKDEDMRKTVRDWIRKSFRHKIMQKQAFILAYTALEDEDYEDDPDSDDSDSD